MHAYMNNKEDERKRTHHALTACVHRYGPLGGQVLWQFTREDGRTQLFGEALANQLSELRLTTNDTVTFVWGTDRGEGK